MTKFIIRKKSFIGMLFGILLSTFFTFISDFLKIELDIVLWFWIMFWFFGLLVYIVYNEYFKVDWFEKKTKRMDYVKKQITQIDDQSKLKIFLFKKSRNQKFDLVELRDLISLSNRLSKINDDEFWINIFLSNINEIPKFEVDYYYGFLLRLNSETSQKKLENILLKKGILIEEDLTKKSLVKMFINHEKSSKSKL